MRTLEQLKKEYIEITTAIIDLGALDTLKELQSQLAVKTIDAIESTPSINESVFKAFNEPRKVGETYFLEEISKVKSSLFNTTNETINNMEEDLTSKIRNINNNMNVSMDELKDSVDIDISDLDDRLNNIDKKLEELEKYLDNLHCEQVEMNNRLEHHEIGINQLFKKFKKLDNLNNKSNNEGSK